MEEIDYNDDSKEGKLRRWVANLQLESWQLELLITGFSIFLLASGYDEYENFRRSMRFDKLVIMNDYTMVISVAGSFIINTIPYAIKFFLVSLLLHLLLRGFWIGIVGLSSVSNNIDFEKLNLKGPFRKHLPKKVRTLDDLIFFLDQISSVIFAYTYLLVFSIISVVLVVSFLFAFMSFPNLLGNSLGNEMSMTAIWFTTIILSLILAVSAVIFFLDSLFFSTFKKSKWFSILYFPIYRFFSIISLSIIYRSIYYHLITNFRRKHIVMVSVVLLAMVVLSERLNSWDRYLYFPDKDVDTRLVAKTVNYDNERQDSFIYTASIPGRIAKESFLPLFIRYSPEQNYVLQFFCPEYQELNQGIRLKDGFAAGMKSQLDTTRTVSELLSESFASEGKVQSALSCIETTYEILIDDEPVAQDFIFTSHPNKGEKGFLQMLDIQALSRGKHIITVRQLEYQGIVLGAEMKKERFKMVNLVEIPFWKE
ncbi:hypothetical protein [Roseivirga sp.]|uniref:hypothetical protein n=1 Tax=Roseivirga sp. TaxID=1964215 RepID=UPI003B516A9A